MEAGTAIQNGPLALAHFTKPWIHKFAHYDIFFDNFSNSLVFYKEGYFVIWDQFDRQLKAGENPFTLNLANNQYLLSCSQLCSKQLIACSVHPSKTCLALQVADTTIVLLFLKEKSAEEVKLSYSKAKYLLGFSFVCGDDFNFFVASNSAIDLYEVKLQGTFKQRTKVVKNISINMGTNTDLMMFMEPLANYVVVIDYKGYCSPFFLNQYKQKQHRGKQFQLDTTSHVASDQAHLSTIWSNLVGAKNAFAEKALSIFRKASGRFLLHQNSMNRNLRHIYQQIQHDAANHNENGLIAQKRTQHQVVATAIYNKLHLVHFNPYLNQIHIYELDPSFSYKYQYNIQMHTHNLLQMQVVDNLLVVHKLDQGVSQLYDLKLTDYHIPLLKQQTKVYTKAALNPQLVFVTDSVFEEEREAEAQEKKQPPTGQPEADFNYLLEYSDDDEKEKHHEVRRYDSKSDIGKEMKEMGEQQLALSEVNPDPNPNEGEEQRQEEGEKKEGVVDSQPESSPISHEQEEIKKEEGEVQIQEEPKEELKEEGKQEGVTKKEEEGAIGEGAIKEEEKKEERKEEAHPIEQVYKQLTQSQTEPGKQEGRVAEPYAEHLVFVDPCFVLDLKNFACYSFKVSLRRILKFALESNRTSLCLLNRSKNKPIFLRNLKRQLLYRQMSLFEMSKLFMRVNSVYKQASIERQSIRKKTAQNRKLESLILTENPGMERMIGLQQKIGRLKPITNFSATGLNQLLMEFAPTSRVLSGEAIIFQNEMVEIFKELINNSDKPLEVVPMTVPRALPSKYVLALILEFVRALFENSIPQQNSQQQIIIKYIIKCQDWATLHSLLQFHVLQDSLDLARILVSIGSKENIQKRSEFCYEPAFQLGLDMMQRLKVFDEIVSALISEGEFMKALDFALENSVHSIKLSNFFSCIDKLKYKGEFSKAEVIIKRVTEIKKFDEAKMRNDPSYKPILLEE